MENWEEDFEVDDLTKKSKRKKGVNGNRKGKRTERELAKILTDRFGHVFSRTLGSGNRWSQTTLTGKANDVFSGDLVTPDNFAYVLECKGGYPKITMDGIFENGNTELDGFLVQVSKDAHRTDKKPLLFWKKDFKPWIVFLKTKDLIEGCDTSIFQYYLKYREWTAVLLDKLLELPDEFFYSKT
jgi:hypothetical protein